MLFHTWIFACFFAVVYPGYLILRKTRYKLPWLLAASYCFYGWWNPLYLALILYSTTIDYVSVIGMAQTRRRWPGTTRCLRRCALAESSPR